MLSEIIPTNISYSVYYHNLSYATHNICFQGINTARVKTVHVLSAVAGAR